MPKFTEFFDLLERKDHLIKKSPNLSEEQKAEVIEYFAKFPHAEKDIDWNKLKDLTYEDFKKIMDGESKTQRRKSLRTLKLGALEEGKDYLIVYDGSKDSPHNDPYEGQLIGYIPLTIEASRLIGSDRVGKCAGQWCTAYQKDDSYWKNYIIRDNKTLVYFVQVGDYEVEQQFQKIAGIWSTDQRDFEELYDAIDDWHDVDENILSRHLIDLVNSRIVKGKLYDKVDRSMELQHATAEEALASNRENGRIRSVEGKTYFDGTNVTLRAFSGSLRDISENFAGFEDGLFMGKVEGNLKFANLQGLSHLSSALLPTEVIAGDDGGFQLVLRNLTQLQKIDDIPEGVTELILFEVPRLTRLPTLPSSLRILRLRGVGIESFIGVNDALKELYAEECPHLEKLMGLPETMDILDIADCPIKAFYGSPHRIEHRFRMYDTQITHLRGGPKEVGQGYWVYGSKHTINSFEGIPSLMAFSSQVNARTVAELTIDGLNPPLKTYPKPFIVNVDLSDPTKVLICKFYAGTDEDRELVEVFGISAETEAESLESGRNLFGPRAPVLGPDKLPHVSSVKGLPVFVRAGTPSE